MSRFDRHTDGGGSGGGRGRDQGQTHGYGSQFDIDTDRDRERDDRDGNQRHNQAQGRKRKNRERSSSPDPDRSYSSSSKFSKPESGEGLGSVVAKHYNELQEKGIEARVESQIFHMRSFNNWIKSMLIGDVVQGLRSFGTDNLIILDMCCGKGGDLLKWLNTNATSHVVFADIAGVSVEQCKERYTKILDGDKRQFQRRGQKTFSADFLTADCTKERLRDKYANPDIAFDLVSVQFSFHYSFESITQAKMMLQNISENLKPGGYFIGTIPNAARIVRQIRSSGGKVYSNPIFRIEFECEEPYPLFGAKYHFKLEDVVNCPEFLVHFGTLEKLAAEYGLVLVFQKTFDEFYHQKQSEGLYLLERMNALETYPPPEGTRLTFRDVQTEYAHAERLYRDGQSGGKPFGTLAKSEWEAVTLYIAFAFQKV